MRIQRLRTRIIVFFVALLALVQLAAFALVNAANSHNAHQKIEEELSVGERVFQRLLVQNAQNLAEDARLLASDFAFREAAATQDGATITSALANHGARIGAGAMLFVGLDGRVIADTLAPRNVPRPFEYPRLLQQGSGSSATATGGHVDIGFLSGKTFQLGAVPVMAPLAIGWIVVGLPVDDAFARDLRQLTSLDVSFLQYSGTRRGWRTLATTADADSEADLARYLPPTAVVTSFVSRKATLAGVDHQIRVVALNSSSDLRVVAVLHRSLADALSAFARLRNTLSVLAFTSLGLSILGSIVIALNITRPLSKIAGAAARIEQGDYSHPVEVSRADEIGVLASSLNHMRQRVAERERRILTLAYQDPLTGLANRSRFSADLEAAIGIARDKVSILLMDLDRFKYVNDTLGHSVGDHVLEQVARRIGQVASSASCIARLGGDEFAVLLTGLAPERVEETAHAIIATLESPILYQEQPLDVGTSIGVAHFPEHGHDAQTLVRNADIAMYAAKRNKSGCQSYDPHYDTHQQEHLSLLGELRQAVEANELRLYYQPKVSLHSANVNSVEALLRWHHPKRGIVSPALFIPFAEHTGYIKVLTQWVLAEAIRQCGEWCRAGLRLQISVNISARDLMNRELPDLIAAMLERHGVPAVLLGLEITESGFMEDPAHAQKVLDRLAALGLRLAIDDYGTGYSSLSYIMKLPVQELKIDRSFISRMIGNADSSTIVRSTIELGHSLGMKVVAEGVEDLEGWNLLRHLGCDDAQGFYMSPPLPAEDLVAWMHAHDAPGGTRDARGTETAQEPAKVFAQRL
jgi:diguanylate cyclase (GGDEF)-like protein